MRSVQKPLRWIGAAAFAVAGAVVALVAVPRWRPVHWCPHYEPPAKQVLSREGGCELRGEVLGIDGEPIVGAVVVFVDALGDVRAVTEADGSYRMARHPSGPTRVEVTAAGLPPLLLHQARIVDPMVLVLGAHLEDFAEGGTPQFVEPGPAGEAGGLCTWQVDIPPDEGPVVVTLDGGKHFLRFVVDASAGRVALPAGLWEVELATKTRRSRCDWTHMEAARLAPRVLQTGCVVDRLGRPVPGATVQLILDGAYPYWPTTAFTDRQGRFRIPVCPHRHLLRAAHPKAGFGGEWLTSAAHVHLVVR